MDQELPSAESRFTSLVYCRFAGSQGIAGIFQHRSLRDLLPAQNLEADRMPPFWLRLLGRAERSAFSYQPSAGCISNNGCAIP